MTQHAKPRLHQKSGRNQATRSLQAVAGQKLADIKCFAACQVAFLHSEEAHRLEISKGNAHGMQLLQASAYVNASSDQQP